MQMSICKTSIYIKNSTPHTCNSVICALYLILIGELEIRKKKMLLIYWLKLSLKSVMYYKIEMLKSFEKCKLNTKNLK